MKVFDGIDEFATAAGVDLGTTDWVVVDQERINKFADATGDHQWIHVDPEAAAMSPFGGTIAHGFLTLSLLPVLWHELYSVAGVGMAVNYGLGKVRFVSPVPTGSRIRASATVVKGRHAGRCGAGHPVHDDRGRGVRQACRRGRVDSAVHGMRSALLDADGGRGVAPPCPYWRVN